MKESNDNKVSALRVRQWLATWNDVIFDPEQNQAKPKEHFYLFSLPASQLRGLAGINRRNTDKFTPRKDDLGIQRQHDPDRSAEIRRYVEGGYPWSGLSVAKRANPEFDNLRKPGWLPTAVVVNILNVGDERSGRILSSSEVIEVRDDENSTSAVLNLPDLPANTGAFPPLEVIDGQHRLYAFDDDNDEVEDYHLPVVAFHGLDISWQAYLFWTINIKPKKINPSLAFDLYPLLREQEWLDSGDVVHVYRESRAQELTEVLWSTPGSPWFRRINMLGGSRRENGSVTQAGFIRSLTASMVKSWRSNRSPVGGIFGGTPDMKEGLSWTRLQQGAFLHTAWKILAEKIKMSEEPWAVALRNDDSRLDADFSLGDRYDEPAFTGAGTLLATDQGVRGFQSIVNDLFFIRHKELRLADWRDGSEFSDVTPQNVAQMAQSLESLPAYNFLVELCESLTSFDWRSSSAVGLSDEERRNKAAFRGSGGYKELRSQLARHLKTEGIADVRDAAAHLAS
ncbi:DGQHR domain-containing protein [Arthrobacter psychrochitiniphilus]|uniref:DGQHR domain-containing protein n=1 Tax=Arthrobacter psychrochitiniphilus TaxID=291045 RepID=UPI003F7BE976